MDIFMATMYLF